MALSIRADVSAVELRALARRERTGRVSSRLLGIANALDGMSRAEAARAAGMDRQTLCDWVQRYNAEGVVGLRDKPKGRPPQRLSEGEQASLANIIFKGPDPKKDAISTWTLPQLCRWIEARFNKRLHPASLSRILRSNGFRGRRHGRFIRRAMQRRKSAFKKGALRRAERCKGRPPGQADRALVKTKHGSGRRVVCAIAWTRGKRPPGHCDQREWTYIFGAVEPATGASFALVLPYADKLMMNLYLAEFAKTLPADTHVVMVLDGAGWHGPKRRPIPVPSGS